MPGKRTLVDQIQVPAPGGPPTMHQSDAPAVQSTAAQGVAGAGHELPHRDKIMRVFGRHDVSGVRAHTDHAATTANAEMGSQAYATGNEIAFGSAPDLHTAAHEAAHVVQQRAGVHLKGGVGQQGDAYERHADAVADEVVAGRPAESLLSAMAGPPGARDIADRGAVQHAVQFIGSPLNQTPPTSAPEPVYGEDKGTQRRFSPEQYIAMWEKEQGRPMTREEKMTIDRGCIGVTIANLGGGNPLDHAERTYATFELAHEYMNTHNKLLDRAAKHPGSTVGPARYVLFASLFWSNQSPDYHKRLNPDNEAFLPDPKTGELDMKNYHYEARSRIKHNVQTGEDTETTYINFDYGFWDEASQCFWHANHRKFANPEQAAAQPMAVLQSTREKFIKGYSDFDRIVFGVALAHNYNPKLAVATHARSR